MTTQLEQRLLKREKLGNLRGLTTTHPSIDFSSNDTLGLARSLELAQAWEKKLLPYNRLGSTGSRLLTGNSSYAEALENRIAHFHGFDAGVIFNCGYMANLGLLSTIGSQESVIFYDIGVHASTHEGIRLSQATAFPFKHNDLEHLEQRLQHCAPKKERFICVESIYSTDGSRAPLSQIYQLATKYDAHLIVDEAHAVGVYGDMGRGSVNSPIFAKVVTFGKALGTYGAIVLGSHTLKQALINFATSYIYTTALPFQILAAISCSYDLFPQMEKERLHIQHLIRLFHQAFPNASTTHIQSIPFSGNQAAKAAAKSLAHYRLDVRPLLSPTVRQGNEMLRVCLHTFNTEEELALLIQHLQSLRHRND